MTVPPLPQEPEPHENQPQAPGDRVRRFSPIEIAFHWWQAIPYPVLMITGAMILLRNLLGEDRSHTLATVHKAAAAVWILALAVTVFVSFWTRTFGRLWGTLRDCLRWSRADLLWLRRAVVHLVRSGPPLPATGRFNPGQKLHLLALAVLVPGFIVTGVWMLAARGALLPWALHVVFFIPALFFLVLHLFLSLINPQTRRSLSGMFSGYVSRKYADEHHPGWLEEPARHQAQEARMVSFTAALLTLLALAAAVAAAVWTYGPARLRERLGQAARIGPFKQAITPGPLSSAHESFGCGTCHEPTTSAPSEKCLDCHKSMQQVMREKQGYHGLLEGRCGTCHREHRGRSGDIRPLDRRTFNHRLARFPLEGPHASLECPACHQVQAKEGPRFAHMLGKTKCDACHTDIQPLIQGKIPGLKDIKPHSHFEIAEIRCQNCHKAAVQSPSRYVDACVKCHDNDRGFFLIMDALARMRVRAEMMLEDSELEGEELARLKAKIELAKKVTMHHPEAAMRLWREILPPPPSKPATQPE